MRYPNIREEELKLKVGQDFFSFYDCTKIIGNVDFCVSIKQREHQLFEQTSLLWAEAKQGKSDLNLSLVQLILTIGKARTFDTHLPPAFLGAFDAEKIAFIPYSEIHDIFYLNDFNWKVTPSNYETKEFQLVHERVKGILDQKFLTFSYEQNHKELTDFIKDNFVDGKTEITKTKIDKNNFMVIYNKWLSVVKPSIAVNWEIAKKNGIIDGDFYLADLLSNENESLKKSLFVLLERDHYESHRTIDETGMFGSKRSEFLDKQKAHHQFWNKYERPPAQEYWDYIVERRDLLVPQDVRERKGSYFTPQIWVELSQKYLTDVLGEDWQDEYYVWDCAAGMGNLLTGLTNKWNIWASTLDKQDVEVMNDRIKNGANLLPEHVFQFDFLNDDFDKLPKPLKAIIDDEEKRKKLVIYINPPYAEAASKETISGIGENKTDVAVTTKVYAKYLNSFGIAGRELFAQFFMRIYKEINGCILAEFSKLKILQAPNFSDFRNNFRPSLENFFVVPANTFDNVKGQFPIGFMIWNTNNQEIFSEALSDVYDENGIFICVKKFVSYDGLKSINDWIISTRNKNGTKNIGFISCKGSDFQNTNLIFIINSKSQLPHPRGSWITDKNIIVVSIYFTVRHCIKATWLNDRDQFLYPNDGWQGDTEFQNDCLAYTLFNNNIQSAYGTNHWIPFTEQEVNAREKFDSNFMTQFIKGKLKPQADNLLIVTTEQRTTPLVFSPEAQAVFDAGRELWSYYHAQPNCNVNASLYDIREHFQGRNEKGKMNNKSTDTVYMGLIGNLRRQLDLLALKVQPKVYEYGFLKG